MRVWREAASEPCHAHALAEAPAIPAPATLLEVEVAAPSHPRHLGPAAIQIRPDSTPRFRGPIQPRGRIPLGENLLRALDAMIPAAVAPAEMRTLAALALDCLTV